MIEIVKKPDSIEFNDPGKLVEILPKFDFKIGQRIFLFKQHPAPAHQALTYVEILEILGHIPFIIPQNQRIDIPVQEISIAKSYDVLYKQSSYRLVRETFSEEQIYSKIRESDIYVKIDHPELLDYYNFLNNRYDKI